MVYGWSEIGLTTVRDVTDSYVYGYCTCVTFCETADRMMTVASSSFKMDASREIKSLKLCKFSLISNVIYNKLTYW